MPIDKDNTAERIDWNWLPQKCWIVKFALVYVFICFCLPYFARNKLDSTIIAFVNLMN